MLGGEGGCALLDSSTSGVFWSGVKICRYPICSVLSMVYGSGTNQMGRVPQILDATRPVEACWLMIPSKPDEVLSGATIPWTAVSFWRLP